MIAADNYCVRHVILVGKDGHRVRFVIDVEYDGETRRRVVEFSVSEDPGLRYVMYVASGSVVDEKTFVFESDPVPYVCTRPAPASLLLGFMDVELLKPETVLWAIGERDEPYMTGYRRHQLYFELFENEL